MRKLQTPLKHRCCTHKDPIQSRLKWLQQPCSLSARVTVIAQSTLVQVSRLRNGTLVARWQVQYAKLTVLLHK